MKYQPLPAEQAEQARADADAYRAVIMQIIRLAGLEIELCGAWLWVSGETRAHKDALKAAGLRWSAKKSMWYWRPAEAGSVAINAANRQDIVAATV